MDMQSQMARPYGHDQAEDPSIRIHHPAEEEEEHHEKGASKVLKKVKEKAKKIKNSLTKHGHGHDHDVEEEDDEYDEQDAPVYESSAVTGLAHPGDTNVPVTEGVIPPGAKFFPVVSSDDTRPIELEPIPEAPSHPLRMSDREERREATSYPPSVSDPSDRGESIEAHQMPMNTRVSPLFATEDVTKTFPPGEDEYLGGQREVNITDPTQQGGGEAGVQGIAESLGKMKVTDESSHQKPGLGFERDFPTRSHEFGLKNESGIGNDSPAGLGKDFPTKSHDEKIESIISEDSPAGSGVESGVGIGKDFATRSHDEKIESIIREDSPTSFGGDFPARSHEFDQKTESVINKNSPTEVGRESEIQKPKPSTYTEKIASATSVIADKAIAAKNVVVSKLGYSGESAGVKQESSVGDETPKSATGYGQKVAGTVTEKLTPVYEKVKETGTNVMKKLPLSGGGTVTEEKTQQVEDRGVSTRDYLAEKLRPGEEDKALSEMITEKLHLGGGEKNKSTTKEVEVTVEKVPSDQITEERDHGESFANEGKVGGEEGMVGKLKGAVTSWLGGTTEAKSSDSVVSDSAAAVSEERRLQESVN